MQQQVTYGSVCSGIEAATVAWEPLGMKPAWFSQFDPEHDYSKGPDLPSAVLNHHWPEVRNLGDMTKIHEMVLSGEVSAPDILVGGTPCQAFSIAGLRGGLSDPRGQLTLAYVELADAIDRKRNEQGKQPIITIWENVPGVLSDKTNAFGCLLAGLAGESSEIEPPGGKWANAGSVFGPKRTVVWRILDAQYFGVAQRRRRVFVVSTARTDTCPSKILFEYARLRRDTPPGREKAAEQSRAEQSRAEQDTSSVAACNTLENNISAISTVRCEIPETEIIATFRMTAFGEYSEDGTASTAKARDGKDATDLVIAATPGSHWDSSGNPHPTLSHSFSTGGIGGSNQEIFSQRGGGIVPAGDEGDVRRLTPIECERLQGFPDNHTLVPSGKRRAVSDDDLECLRQYFPNITTDEAFKLASDGHRYKAIGNSMAVPVMRWLGTRVMSEIQEKSPDPTSLAKVKPFLKWAGGKYKEIDQLKCVMPAGARLIEPFVGAGSVFMNLRGFSEYLLADINPDLINLYQQLEESPIFVKYAAGYLIATCDSDDIYKQIRNEFNSPDVTPARKAALFLALNRTCFNGLTRYSKSRRFNVSWNKEPGTSYVPNEELDAYRYMPGGPLKFICSHFRDTIQQAGAGDVVFCDPPYEPLPDTEGFTQYAAEGFTFTEQEELAECCKAAHQRGARIVITNSGAPKIRDLYKKHGFDVKDLVASRSISCKGKSRGKIRDVIAIL